MKRYNQNLSHDPIKFCTWALLVDSITESDFIWLKSLDIPIRIDRPEHTFDVMGGGTHKVSGKASYSVETTTDKQRSMLLLKYGNLAMLIQEETLLPGAFSTCTLSDITW